MRTIFLERLDVLKEQYGKPTGISLSIYEDDESLKCFRPQENWQGGALEHKQVMEQLKVEAEKRGFEVRLVEIKTTDYWRWLGNGGQDSTQKRAEYISRLS